MKILFDEGVPRQLARFLIGHDIGTVVETGWASTKNGKLLALIEEARFQVFVTADKNIEFQQSSFDLRSFGMVVLSTNHWESMQSDIERVVEAVNGCGPGTIRQVDCGRFVARRFRKPSN